MRFGICLSNYGDTLDIEGLKKLSLLAEELDYDSIWLSDHILMPKNSGTPYEKILEPISAMAYLSALTKEIKIGISALVLPIRNPIVVAKEIATIDLLSNGRVMLAIGAGWVEREFKFLNAEFGKRGKIVDESIELMKSLWSGKPSYKGKYIKQFYEEAIFEPNINREIELWIAGDSESAMKRALKYGHAWHPYIYQPPEVFQKKIEKYKSLAQGNLKPIRARVGFNFTASENYFISSRFGDRRMRLTNNMNINKEIIEKLESMEVDYIILDVNPNGKISIGKQEEAIRAFASKFL
jgi:Coenzyme F420-dependent N5,N10-methylene tetrahydromethanopterin reductase and related flavin-dependent oxidoreductases